MTSIASLFVSVLFATTTFARPLDRLVLRTGETIVIRDQITIVDERVVFRSEGGALYSIEVSEIDFEASDRLAASAEPLKPVTTKPFKVSEEEKERLLREISENRSGRPPQPQPWEVEPLEKSLSKVDVNAENEEWSWRNRARTFDENVTRAEEELRLLQDREDRLEDEIRNFYSRGYRADQYSYQVLQLQVTRDMMERARLNVEQAMRLREQFRDEARRRNIMPGWIR